MNSVFLIFLLVSLPITRCGCCHTALVIIFSSSSNGSTTVVKVPMVTLFFLTGSVADVDEVEDGGDAVIVQFAVLASPFPLLLS